MPRPTNLTSAEIAAAFTAEPWADRFPPILNLSQFAQLFGVSRRTAFQWLASGDFQGATTRIGKHRRFWRDRAIQIAFGRDRTRPRRHQFTKTYAGPT